MAARPSQDAPLQLYTVQTDQPLATVNRLLAALHVALAAAAIAHRGAHVMLAPDLVLLFLWALSQAPMWRPVSRAAFPSRLSRPALPAVDVMVVTADPDKEPAAKVMNTVVSAMALDYPGGRLSVYLSDDAGSPRTLLAARKAYALARAWVPFCRKYGVRCPCPDRFFAGDDQLDLGDHHRQELDDDRLRIKNMYETFKEGVEEVMNDATLSQSWTKADHDAHVEIITDEQGQDSSHSNSGDGDGDEDAMPLLVYVSREKRRSSTHHFKAGALNVLLRVSSLMSNSPYVMVLDCDMYCNSRSSLLEAMCFHLDGRRRADLAFVQFPQMFHNLSSSDIYANELRPIFWTRWKGLDGLRGPILSGTGFCVRRDAVYGAGPGSSQEQFSGVEVGELKRRFGVSNGHIASLRRSGTGSTIVAAGDVLPQDAELVASCDYETGTEWGEDVGFLYQSVVEDYFTGYRQLYCRGWTSVYCFPATGSRPPFLGSVPTNLNDALVQNKRWMSGLLAVGLSRHCPLASAAAISVPQSMGFAYYAFTPLYAFPLLCYATVPQLCFLRGATSFSEAASTLWFAAVFASSSLQHLVEVSVAKRGLAARTWWNEQRFWALNAVTGQLFACLGVALSLVGAGGRAVDFDLTSKASGDRLYRDGVFDFAGCSALLLPATTLCLLNAAALVGGVWKMVGRGGNVSGTGELFLLCYVAALSYPLLQGMFLRRDPARVPARITAVSVAIVATLLSLFG
ncbi:cellulose synthase A catalytic subunit 7 [UDP-forming]-like [Triticum dicoccoides]|uniref:cellulose synthase A catalytic subunit 7 [UDP-forming]-like n=1 Tax=Triticum dicoccoides TaxID=85692 RepID=UPI00188F7B9F|nr:cellulose synthase A catalytic subunit 7 [UDP-forming]-like [Triticum dicoccoides]